MMGLVAIQSVMVTGFIRKLRNFDVPLIGDDEAPPAIIILCLRGTDPFLKDCLSGLLNQDYPNYQVRIVVDSPDDPAHQVLSHILAETGAQNIHIENLVEKSPTCSLKCSSLRQVMHSLEPDCEIVAQLDADTVAHPTWLRELATALKPTDVGAATGNRWYMPTTPSVGSLVRYTWNAAAIVQMYWYRVAWGGTLALKAKVLRESDLLEKWGLAFCEDTMLHSQLKKLGLRVQFIPSLMMINRENISLGNFFRWVSRQLMTAKLYHPAWPAVLIHGIISAVIPLTAGVLLMVALTIGNLTAAAITLGTLWLYGLSLFFSLLPMVRIMRQIASRRGQPSRWIAGWGFLKCAAVMPLTQVVYPAALAAATFAKSTDWRGIRYQIDGPWQIRMLEYLPYQPVLEQSHESL